jgi:hypothetical protein
MKITCLLNVEDWVNFQEYYRKKNAPNRRWLLPVIIAITFSNILLGIWLYFIQGATTYTWVALICTAILFYLIYLHSQTRKRLWKAGKKLEQENPDVFGTVTFDMDEKGISIRTKSNHKFLTWDKIDKYESNKHYCFIYSKKGIVYIIPKRDVIQKSFFEWETLFNNYLNDSIKINK